MVKDEINHLVEEQKKLEGKYEQLMGSRSGDLGQVTRQANVDQARSAGRDLTNSTYVMNRNLKQNPLTMDNLSKVQEDRYVRATFLSSQIQCACRPVITFYLICIAIAYPSNFLFLSVQG